MSAIPLFDAAIRNPPNDLIATWRLATRPVVNAIFRYLRAAFTRFDDSCARILRQSEQRILISFAKGCGHLFQMSGATIPIRLCCKRSLTQLYIEGDSEARKRVVYLCSEAYINWR